LEYCNFYVHLAESGEFFCNHQLLNGPPKKEDMNMYVKMRQAICLTLGMKMIQK